MNYTVEYGEAAFYGPKLDFMVKDILGRKWQLGTIQVDYNLPERFNLSFKGKDNQLHRPIMIHRAPFGSMERFVAILLEQTAGDFPLWLTPSQVSILIVSEKYEKYGDKVAVLGFPSNDFLYQEPGDNKKIKNFCSVNYGVTFPMFSKVKVKKKESQQF